MINNTYMHPEDKVQIYFYNKNSEPIVLSVPHEIKSCDINSNLDKTILSVKIIADMPDPWEKHVATVEFYLIQNDAIYKTVKGTAKWQSTCFTVETDNKYDFSFISNFIIIPHDENTRSETHTITTTIPPTRNEYPREKNMDPV